MEKLWFGCKNCDKTSINNQDAIIADNKVIWRGKWPCESLVLQTHLTESWINIQVKLDLWKIKQGKTIDVVPFKNNLA